MSTTITGLGAGLVFALGFGLGFAVVFAFGLVARLGAAGFLVIVCLGIW